MLKTISEAAAELGISVVTLNKYKNETLKDDLAPHITETRRNNKNITAITDDGIDIVRSFRENMVGFASETDNKDEANSSEADNEDNNDTASGIDAGLIGDSKVLNTLLSSYEQQIKDLNKQIEMLHKQFEVKDNQLEKADARLKEAHELNKGNLLLLNQYQEKLLPPPGDANSSNTVSNGSDGESEQGTDVKPEHKTYLFGLIKIKVKNAEE